MKGWMATLLVAAAAAGCLGGDDADSTAPGDAQGPAQRYDLPEDPMPEGPGHDHTAPAAHRYLWNYDFSDRDPLLQNAASIAGVHALDLQADHLFGAIYGAHAADVQGGLAIWDLSDPAHPALTGRWYIPGAVGGDRSLEATEDGDYAVLGTEAVTCLGQVDPTPFRVYLFDTTDKSAPVPVDVVTTAGPSRGTPTSVAPSLSAHSVVVKRIAGEDYAFIFGDVYRIDRPDSGPASLVDTGTRVPVGHDLFIRDTPWGGVWGLSANGDRNFQVFDLSDPLSPVELASFATSDEYYLHTADVAFFGDEAVLVVSSEDWQDHVSPMWIFDVSALRDHTGEPLVLEPIGTWQNPGDHTALGTSFSLHNPRFGLDGILTISSYHAGLWQLDFRHADLRGDPAEIAYAVFADGEQTMVEDPVYDLVESELCGLGLTLDAPTYMDVELGPDGVLYAADVYMGLYTFVPAADHPVYGAAAPSVDADDHSG